MNPILFEWLRLNIEKDEDEQVDLIQTVLEDLHPWINPDMYHVASKEKERKSSEQYKVNHTAFLDIISKHAGKKLDI